MYALFSFNMTVLRSLPHDDERRRLDLALGQIFQSLMRFTLLVVVLDIL